MYNPDDPLTLTPNGVPISLRPYFQEYSLEKLVPERAADVIIERSLRYGTRQELHWLFKQYGRSRIADWVRDYGWSFLDPVDFQYWRVVLDVEEYRSRAYQSVWRQRWTSTGK